MAETGTESHLRAEGLPPLVVSAVGLAERLGFENSCAIEQGRLLGLLAGGCSGGRIGETGTGCGVGLAWMIEAATDDTSFVSIEEDDERFEAAIKLFAERANVRVLHGDWKELAGSAPFDLLVLDGGGKGKEPGDGPPLEPEEWLAPDGTIVLDDFVPSGAPGAAQQDGARRYWLEHPRLRSTELQLTPTLATLVGRLR